MRVAIAKQVLRAVSGKSLRNANLNHERMLTLVGEVKGARQALVAAAQARGGRG